jgi:hypothetical protein
MSNVNASIARGRFPQTVEFAIRGRLEEAQWLEFKEALGALCDRFGLEQDLARPTRNRRAASTKRATAVKKTRRATAKRTRRS